jgi:hypothetical protein
MSRPFSNANAERLDVLLEKNKSNNAGLSNAEIREFRGIEERYMYPPQPLKSLEKRIIRMKKIIVDDASQPMADRLMALRTLLGAAEALGQPLEQYIPADVEAWIRRHGERMEKMMEELNVNEITREMIGQVETEAFFAEQNEPVPAGAGASGANRLPDAGNLEVAEAGEARVLRPSANNQLRYRGVSIGVAQGGRRHRKRTIKRRQRKRKGTRRH